MKQTINFNLLENYMVQIKVHEDVPLDISIKFTNFIHSIFPDYNFHSNVIDIETNKFIAAVSLIENFFILNQSVSEVSIFDKNLIDLIDSVPSYEDAISNRKLIKEEDIGRELLKKGFSKQRILKSYQLKNVAEMYALQSCADFSVPGAGKTTESLAFFALNRESKDEKLLIISPINAFSSWELEIPECLDNFTIERLSQRGDSLQPEEILDTDADAFIINYEKITLDDSLRQIIAKKIGPPNKFSLILDESHKFKSQKRGEAMITLAPLVRNKLILSGTPMPQSPRDLENQFKFLYPQEQRIPIDQLVDRFQNIFVRTTKSDLSKDLPILKEKTIRVKCSPAHAAVYRHMEEAFIDGIRDISNPRELSRLSNSVMTMMRFCTNPKLENLRLKDIDEDLANEVFLDGDGNKVNTAIKMARAFAQKNEKVVIWTSWPKNIEIINGLLQDLNPVYIHGGIKSGDVNDPNSREYKINKFKNDDSCFVFIANPASSAESISLHQVCRKCIYVDRTFNAAQYLQSRDRIHRIGMDISKEVEVYILIHEDTIDERINYRLNEKIERLEEFLDDDSISVTPVDVNYHSNEVDSIDGIDDQIELDDLEYLYKTIRDGLK